MEQTCKKGIRVMIVDDFEDSRVFLGDWLSSLGFFVVTAADGDDALEKSASFKPHLFILDVKMPGMNGIELLQALDVKNNPYEVILMSGYENIEDAKKAMEFGAFSYLTKPLIIQDVQEQINKALLSLDFKRKRFAYLQKLENDIQERTTELERTVAALQNMSRRQDAIINCMGEGLLALDTMDTIVLINEQAARIFNGTVSSYLGVTIWSALEKNPVCEQLRVLVNNTGPFFLNSDLLTINMKEEGTHYYKISVTDYIDESGEKIGMIITFIDQTAKIDADRMRNSILSIVAHEFRTPLTVLMNAIEILTHTCEGNATINDTFGDMKTSCKRLNYLIDNVITTVSLFDMSSPLNITEIDLFSLISNQFDRYTKELKKKNIMLSYSDELKKTVIVTDPKYLSIALGCLIHNAIKFNRDGGHISVSCEYINVDSERSVVISISDEGIGIPASEQKRMFHCFFQEEAPLRRTYDGIGIGLFQVKRAIENLHGSIKVNSTKGKGSTFTIELPQ
jgi:signal transduction histidine kinase